MRQKAYRYYLLIILVVIQAFNSVDSLVLGIVQQDIRRELSLTDTQLGLLTGIAFGLFYSLIGIWLARWADRGNRVTIISLTTALWGIGVALLGRVTNFAQLLVVRIGVAVGGAGSMPTANSLIPEYFSRAERPRAASIYFLGGPLSLVIGYFVAGWLNQYFGWRATFEILSLCGILLAALAWLTLKEPRFDANAARYTISVTEAADSQEQTSLRSVFALFIKNRTLRHLLLNNSVISFFGYASSQWLPAYFIRSYGLSTGELGTWFAIVLGTSGVVAMYVGGEFATRFAPANERLQLTVTVVAYCISCVLWACVYLAPNQYIAFGLIAVTTIAGAASTGPLFALIQTLSPQCSRAQSIAVFNLCANLLGLGLGPLAVGMLSDALKPWAGEESLRYSLLATCPGTLWAAWHILRARKTVTSDLEAVKSAAEYATGEKFPGNTSVQTRLA